MPVFVGDCLKILRPKGSYLKLAILPFEVVTLVKRFSKSRV